MLEQAPVLIPVYAHHYMPEIMDDNVPIIFIHDVNEVERDGKT